MGTNGQQNKRAERKADAKERQSRSTRGEYVFDAETLICLGALALVLVQEGGALRMGRTRDGGALAIGLYRGDENLTEYVRPNEDLHQALCEIAEVWCDEGAEGYIGTLMTLRGQNTAER